METLKIIIEYYWQDLLINGLCLIVGIGIGGAITDTLYRTKGE